MRPENRVPGVAAGNAHQGVRPLLCGLAQAEGQVSGWVKFENATPENHKVIAVSDRAFRLWFDAVCYCSRTLSDGEVSAVAVRKMAGRSKRSVDELIGAGLFLEREDGVEVKDYLKYNPSRAEIEANRERVSNWRNEKRTRTEPVQNASRASGPVLGGVEGEIFEYWRKTCRHTSAKRTRERLAKIKARLNEGYSEEDIRRAIDGAAHGAFVNEQGKRFDDIELICRNGSKLESFMDRAGNVRQPSRISLLHRAKRARDMGDLDAYRQLRQEADALVPDGAA